jgi:DNA-binding NtrC family response regulator
MSKPLVVAPFLVENCDLSKSIKGVFEEHGFDLHFVKHLSRHLSEEGPPDVLLLEPSLFHWEWLTELLRFQKSHPHIPVILFSSLATAERGLCPITEDSHVYLANDIKVLNRNLKKILAVKAASPKNILFVDDDEKMLNAYGRMLRRSPWKIFKSTSGENALKIVESNRIDLIVTDIKMPEMHGMEFISKIRSRNKEVPIVVSSGYPGMKDDIDLKYHGIEAFISKPIAEDELYAELAAILSA